MRARIAAGPLRITHQLQPQAVAAVPRLVAEARKEFAPARKRRPSVAVRAMGWL
jgi:hypothetical protein